MPPPATAEAHPLTVVVADDVEGIRELMGHWLEEQGHAVIRAEGGREVIRMLASAPCDLVVTDILMPDGDGLDVVMGVKRTRPGTRILAVSGGGKFMGAGEALNLARAIGADGILFKPFNRAQFMEALGHVLPEAKWETKGK